MEVNYWHRQKNIIGIFDYQIETITSNQRLIFTWIVSILLILSITGNSATIFVNFRRKMRPFFRTCLLSLAFSDLITSIFTATGYISQFTAKFVQIWHLGDIMCSCIPFMSTAAILINSMTLVGIAFDRYMAVMKVVSTVNWEPKMVCCFAFVILVWGLAAGLASPMLMSFHTSHINIIITDPENKTHILDVMNVEMCSSDKDLNSFYYVIIFSVVFIPLVVTFIWLNAVIAREICKRKKLSKGVLYSSTFALTTNKSQKTSCKCNLQNESCNCNNSQTTSSTETLSKKGGNSSHGKYFIDRRTHIHIEHHVKAHTTLKCKSRLNREARQLRMFLVIISLIAVFLILRLPTWIFLLMRLYGLYNQSIHWVLHFSFGTISLTNCVLNPLFYTFVAETIYFISTATNKLRNFFSIKKLKTPCFCRLCDNFNRSGGAKISSTACKNNASNNKKRSNNWESNDHGKEVYTLSQEK